MSIGDKITDAAQNARDKAGDAVDKGKDAAHDARDSALLKAGELRGRTEQKIDDADEPEG